MNINYDELRSQLRIKTVAELKRVAKGFGIEIPDKIKKDELVELIVRKHIEEEIFIESENEEVSSFEEIQYVEKTSDDFGNTVKIDIDLLDKSPMNFFKPLKEKKYNEVKESIKALGLLTPIIVRPKSDGRYEILAGHNRVDICKDLGWNKIPAIVKDVDDDEAQEIIADTNVAQRDEMTPMEIAKAYDIKRRAIGKRQGQRTDLSKDDIKGKTEDIIGKEYEVSGMTVQRYLRLINLNPELQKAVDDGRIKVRTAFELGLIDKDTQEALLNIVDINNDNDIKQLSKNINKIKKALKEKNKLSKEELQELKNKGKQPEVKPLTESEIAQVISEQKDDSGKDKVIKLVIPADYDPEVREFIEFKAEGDPVFLLDIIKQYLATSG